MAWAVFYPTTQLPLLSAVRDDPAFSPDPRAHPHFPLHTPASYRPRLPPRPSGPPPASLSAQPNGIPKHPSRRPFALPAPEGPPKSHSADPPPYVDPKSVASQSASMPRKGRVRALVRRLTGRHNLDRIDELDETDPFGGSYHHHGPYEAIGSNLVQPSLPQGHSDAPHRGNIHHSRRRELHPRPRHLGQHQSASQPSSSHDETGLSLSLEPGQVLQQNTIYTSHPPSIVSVPGHFRPPPNTTAINTRPVRTRNSSLLSTRTHSSKDSSPIEFLDRVRNQPPPSLHAPRERCFGDNTLNIPKDHPLHHDHDATPYVPRQIEKTVFPPPRHESRFHNSGPPQSPQRSPQPSFGPTSGKTSSTERALPALSPHGSRHKSVHSLNSTYALNSTITQSSSGIQSKPLEPLRMRHLPKRLVMPAPLQPQPSEPQAGSFPAEATTWQDGYSDDHSLERTHFGGQPITNMPEPKLLRKRSSAFPTKTPIPVHAPVSRDDVVPTIGTSPAKTANEGEGTKERTRRRKLSKRKNDI